MTDLEISLPPALDAAVVPEVVETVCAGANLHLTMKTTLKTYAGCLHWHFKLIGEPGMLEVTWWPSRSEQTPSRLWLSVHGNRNAAWIVPLKPEIAAMIEARLAA